MNCVKSQVPASLSLHSVGVRPIEVEHGVVIIIIIIIIIIRWSRALSPSR